MADSNQYINLTIIAPNGTSQHGRSEFLCVPATWITVVKFFLVNYVAHAFTICLSPGEKFFDSIFASILACFLPVSAINRGMNAMYRLAYWHGPGKRRALLLGSGSPEWKLRTAVSAGAVGIMVRNDKTVTTNDLKKTTLCFERNALGWNKPEARLRGVRNNESDTPQCDAYKICVEDYKDDPSLLYYRDIAGKTPNIRYSNMEEGNSEATFLCGGYQIIEFPKAAFDQIEIPEMDGSSLEIPQSSNLFRASIALAQVGYTAFQVVRGLADEFDMYGYSAYPWTVLPYFVMALVNLTGNLSTPVYPNVYLIRNSILTEAENRGLQYENCVIGRLKNDEERIEGRRQEFRVREKSAPDISDDIVKVCFEDMCIRQHRGTIAVKHGKPICGEIPHSREYFKISVSVIVGFLTFVPFIISQVKNYPQSRTPTGQVAFPLWVAWGNILGVFITLSNLDSSFFTELGALLEPPWKPSRKDRTRKHFRKNNGWKILLHLFFVLTGIGTAAWNFYSVATQIMEFGSCSRISTW